MQLKNKTRRMQVFQLTHEHVCTEQKCHCSRHLTGVQDVDPATGQKTLRGFRQRLPGSITLMARDSDGDTLTVSAQVAAAPEIRAAIKRGDIAGAPDKSEPPTAPETPEAKAPPRAAKKTAPAAALDAEVKE